MSMVVRDRVTARTTRQKSRAPLVLVVAVFAAWLIPAEALVSPLLVGLMLFALPHWRPRTTDVLS